MYNNRMTIPSFTGPVTKVRLDDRLPGVDSNGYPIRNNRRRNNNRLELRSNRNNDYDRNDDQQEQPINRFLDNHFTPTNWMKDDVKPLRKIGRSNNNTRRDDKPVYVKKDTDIVKRFVDFYIKNRTNSNAIIEGMGNLIEVAEVMSHYYDPKYENENQLNSMNRLIDLATTRTFIESLKTALNRGIINISTGENIVYLKKLINLTLITSSDKMSNDVMSTAVDIIVETLDTVTVGILMEEFGISEDLAEELTVGIPTIGYSMSKEDVKQYAPHFIDYLINNANTAINVMTSDKQYELFWHIFNEPETDNVYKAVGECLIQPRMLFDAEKNPDEDIIYNEYVEMLFKVLNSAEIRQIESTLRYALKKTTNLADEQLIITEDLILKYENVAVAMRNLNTDRNASRYYR